MKVIYRGFDGLDVAFQGQVPGSFLAILESAKEQAIEGRQTAMIEYRGQRMTVAESGARGGYAFRCDTGPHGATWFFKRPKPSDPWGVRVSVKSLALALHRLGGVRARLYGFMEALGIVVSDGGESIGRVDYAVDILAPGFVLVPDRFVMHSHTKRADHSESVPIMRHGTSGRVDSVTVGKMPNRQIIVYDKRREVIDRGKVHWWTIWNTVLEQQGAPLLDPKDREGSRVWRVELRAGKEHLKKCLGGKRWPDLDDKLGSLLLKAMRDVRYTNAMATPNRSRWPDHPIWSLVRQEVAGDLFEMSCDLDLDAVREVLRQEHAAILWRQLRGLIISYAVANGINPTEPMRVPGLIGRDLQREIDSHRAEFEERMARATARHVFLDPRLGAPSPVNVNGLDER